MIMGLPRWQRIFPVVKNLPANARGLEMCIPSLGQENPLEEGIVTHSDILGQFHGQRSLVGYSPGSCNESEMIDRLSTHTQVASTTLGKIQRCCILVEIHVAETNRIHTHW